MSAREALSDDYVAEILKKDAQRKDQNRYLSAGLGSLLGSSRPRSNAPKPNTRFLRNIVREADSHNAALRKKEEEESKERMRGLKRDSHGRTRERDQERRRDRDSARRRHRSRSRSPRRERESHRARRDEHRRRRSKDRSPEQDPCHPHEEDSDSDPLESMIGPKPPPKNLPRGRGATSTSNMDSRFDPNYDPKTDVGLDQDEEGDDWDMALEALRDRAKWRKSGAERLRAAGFTEDEVEKWEKGGGGRDDGEKDISDVRWRKKGEGREWDRGKTVDGGRMDVKAEWGRFEES